MSSGLTGIVAAAILGALGAHHASAAELFVIAHPRADLSAVEIRDVFLGEKQFSGSSRIVPVDNDAAQKFLLDKVMRMSDSKYSTVWIKKSFREGLNPPPLKSGDAEVIDFVMRTPGAVGYVTTAPGRAKILLTY